MSRGFREIKRNIKRINMITTKKHNQIIEHKDKTISDYYAKILKLEKELEQAKNLESILNRFNSIFTTDGVCLKVDYMSGKLILPDDVLVYVEDLFGGKVIKQEATKAILIESDGTIKTGLTKQKADKGYGYKLVRNSGTGGNCIK